MSTRNKLLEEILAATSTGGGVQSVTGDSVDNADPSNPVIIEKQHFIAASLLTIIVGTDANSPSFFTGMSLISSSTGFTSIDTNGVIVNESGRVIKSMSGSISFQPSKSGGGTTSLSLWSERSIDGATWTQNSESLRTIEISNNGETFKTSISLILDWEDGHYLRFRIYASGGGSVSFVSPTDTVLGGEVITGASAVWELSEN